MTRAARRACRLAAAVFLGLAAGAPAALALAEPEPGAQRDSRAALIEVVSFGVAPVEGLATDGEFQPKPEDIVHREDVSAEDPREARETRTRVAETWPALLLRLGVALNAVQQGQLSALPQLIAGKFVRGYDKDGDRPAQLEYVVDDGTAYTIVFGQDALQVTPHASDPRIVERMRRDPSKASLFTATDAIGLPDAIVLQLAEIFAGDVDFHRELHYGYRCAIVYEVLYRDGHIDRPGKILAAEFAIRNRTLSAYYFDGVQGSPGYYTETGRSMRKIFRRSPVEFSRRTSEYTLARFHPILKVWRAHRGTDYAAPVGTPVLATSDGTVRFAGERGEYGNLIVLSHHNRYQTYYGHLQRFANGIAPGAVVAQGQVIGYVGMSGLATGPHLHYEYRLPDGEGEWASVPEPEVKQPPPASGPAFVAAVRDYREKLAVASRAHVVTLD